MTNDHSGSARGVKSDETLVEILAHLREVDGAGVTDIATHLGLAKSTVHDHLSTMVDHGFVVKRGSTYRLGLEFFGYGQYVRAGFDVYEAAKPVVDELADTTDEMVWLTVHQRGQIMYLYGHAGDTNVNENALLGSWTYMHCNSSGKAILAHLPREDVEYAIDRYGLPARTENTITDRDELFAELERIRERGYALNLGEDLAGIHAVSVPLRYEERVRGALAFAGPAHRVTRERCESELVERLMASANDVELNLAYR
ncbi:IclR family transcriptional regulator [Salinigranum sp.]|uniref:IclR family transcriptional regulator n=1 Tax=Salinigranum sp. TaxID=1966351 RepID=UPI003562F1E4